MTLKELNSVIFDSKYIVEIPQNGAFTTLFSGSKEQMSNMLRNNPELATIEIAKINAEFRNGTPILVALVKDK